MTQLDTCTALIAVVTENFIGSSFANQEAGIVLGKGKQVIPIRFGDAKLPGFLESLQAIPATNQTLNVAVKKTVHAIEVRDPSYIRTGYIPTPDAEETAIQTIKEHILRTGQDTKSVRVNLEDIEIYNVILNEKNKTFELTGTANLQREQPGYHNYWANEAWSWTVVIDAISGRVMVKKITK